AEGIHELLAVHLRKELGALLAVAVLAGQRPAVGDDEVGRLLHERAVRAQAVDGSKVEVRVRVDAAVTEMPEARAPVPVLREQGPKITQILADALGGNRGVFPPRPVVLPVGWKCGRGQSRSANIPQPLLLRGV